MSTFVATRSFGEARVSLINSGTGNESLSGLFGIAEDVVRAAVPELDRHGGVDLSFTSGLIQLGGATILVDAGFNPGEEHIERTPGVVGGLAELDLTPADVTHVLITHAHWDHVEGAVIGQGDGLAPRYSGARVLLGRGDWDAARAGHPHFTRCLRHLEALERAGRLDLVDGDHQVVSGVRMLEAAGETPGHHVVWVESAGQSVVFVGDLYHHACEAVHLDWAQVGTDAVMAGRSRARILGLVADADATIVAAHPPFPGWSRVQRAEGGTFRLHPD